MASKSAVPHEMCGITDLDHDQEEQQQSSRIPFPFDHQVRCWIVSSEIKVQQRRSVAQRINANQQPKLDFRDPFQKAFMVAGKRDSGRDKQRRIDRDQNRVQLIPVQPHHHILKRGKEKEDPKQRSVVTSAGGRHRNELAKGPKRNQPEKGHGHPALKKHGYRQHQADRQPGKHAVVERPDDCWVDVRFGTSFEDLPHNGQHPQHPQQTDQQDDRSVVAQQGLLRIVKYCQ